MARLTHPYCLQPAWLVVTVLWLEPLAVPAFSPAPCDSLLALPPPMSAQTAVQVSFMPVDVHGTRKGLRWDTRAWMESLGVDEDVEVTFGPLDAADAVVEGDAALPKALPEGVAEVQAMVEFPSARVSNVLLKSRTCSFRAGLVAGKVNCHFPPWLSSCDRQNPRSDRAIAVAILVPLVAALLSLPDAWYYEVEVVSGGLAQIGWADPGFASSADAADGVGDNDSSWAYDGSRQLKWHAEKSAPYGDAWAAGDIVCSGVHFGARDPCLGNGLLLAAICALCVLLLLGANLCFRWSRCCCLGTFYVLRAFFRAGASRLVASLTLTLALYPSHVTAQPLALRLWTPHSRPGVECTQVQPLPPA
jgi:hypothetical protein